MPVTTPNEVSIDESLDDLCRRIASATGEAKPVLIKGFGGTGKSTTLRRLAELTLQGSLSEFEGSRVIRISGDRAEESLVASVTRNLRSDFRLPITPGIAKSQMQSAKFLVLCDDFGEIAGDARDKIRNNFQSTACDSYYKSCRFVFFSRPYSVLPNWTTFTLQPFSKDRSKQILASCVSPERQAELRHGCTEMALSSPVAASLLMAVINAVNSSSIRYSLLERYCQSMLRLHSGEIWDAWRDLLSFAAYHLFLNSPERPIGMAERNFREQITPEILSVVTRHDHFVNDSFSFLQTLAAAGLLRQHDARWQFTHSAIASYFAALYVARELATSGECEILRKCARATYAGQFLPMISCLREVMNEEDLPRLVNGGIPIRWESELRALDELPPRITVHETEYVLIPGGSFKMGTEAVHASELKKQSEKILDSPTMFAMELPQNDVSLNDFYIARFPVTNMQYQALIMTLIGRFPTATIPGRNLITGILKKDSHFSRRARSPSGCLCFLGGRAALLYLARLRAPGDGS